MKHVAITVAFFATMNLVCAQDIAFMDGALSSQQKADLYYRQMSYDKALTYYQKVLDKSPDNASVKLKMAQCYVQLNDLAGARTYYETAITSSEATADDVLNYAEALSANGEYEKAARWYDVYREKNPGDDRPRLKKEAISKINQLYEDSVAYSVQPVSFNSAEADFSPAYWNNQTVFVSNRSEKKMFKLTDARTRDGFLDLYRLENGQVVPFGAVNKNLNEGPVTFFDNGTKVMVTTNQKVSSALKEGAVSSRLQLDIYTWKDGEWRYDSTFPYNNAAYSVGHPAFDEKKQVLYFASNKPGGKGGTDIYTSEYQNGQWLEPKNLESINTQGDELFPFIAKNSDLYFASNGHGGLGGLDLFKTNVLHSKAIVYNLGYPVNTTSDDFGLVLDDTGRQGFISSNRKSGKGSDDIYALTISRIAVEIKIVNQVTAHPEKADKVVIIDQVTGREVPYERAGDKIVFDAIKDRHYQITVESGQFKIEKKDFQARGDQPVIAFDIPVAPLTPLAKEFEKPVMSPGLLQFVRFANLTKTSLYQMTSDQGLIEVETTSATGTESPVEISSVYFRFDSDEFSAGEENLGKLADLLIRYSNVDLQIVAYSDASGSVEYNDELSRKRIRKVVSYLGKKGVVEKRIQATVVGERKLYVPCDPGTCTEEESQQNRRTEFFLVPQGKN